MNAATTTDDFIFFFFLIFPAFYLDKTTYKMLTLTSLSV